MEHIWMQCYFPRLGDWFELTIFHCWEKKETLHVENPCLYQYPEFEQKESTLFDLPIGSFLESSTTEAVVTLASHEAKNEAMVNKIYIIHKLKRREKNIMYFINHKNTLGNPSPF